MRKGQAAMEFLMTYGWAILVVLAAIAALAYFGVLSPDKFFPDKCVVQGGGFSCVESKVDSASSMIQVRIKNSGGADMQNVVVQLTNTNGCGIVESAGLYNASLLNGADTGVLNYTCSGSTFPTSTLKSDIKITYLPVDATLSQTASGSIVRRVS